MDNIVINQMPVKTWNWLKMNEVSLDDPGEIREAEPIVIAASESGQVSDLPFEFADRANTGGNVEISVDKDINHCAVMDFKNNGGGFASVETKVKLAKGARLTLVQVHRLGNDFRFTGRIDADVDEKADFRLVQVFIRGREVYSDVKTDLGKRKSALHIDTGYLTTDDHILDINYNAVHTGELSMSDISVNGVMTGTSEKRFRGTIDFRHGAEGAVGNELENVILMDPDVINKTIPIILCEEEDVEGNHGATIGRLNDDMLYYMQSRGMDEASIRELMKTAYIKASLRRVPAVSSRSKRLCQRACFCSCLWICRSYRCC